MEYLNTPHQELYPESEPGEQSQYPEQELAGQSTTQSSSKPTSTEENPRLARREWNERRRKEKKERNERAENLSLDDTDIIQFKEIVNDWYTNKRPRQFPTVLFKVLSRLDEERKRWLAKNPDVGSEIIVEAWVSPKPNEYPFYRNSSGIGLWKWLSQPVKTRSNKFTLISLTGITEEILKALLINYDIKIQSLYAMVFVDSFAANIQTATENVFALSFDFLRLVPLGNERRNHTQTFLQLDNKRRNHILTWKWKPFGSESYQTDRAFEIARAVIWIRRDLDTGTMIAIFYMEPKKCRKIMTKTQAQWRMSEFCSDVEAETRSTQSLPILENEGQPEEIFHFLARYFKETFQWNRVLALHQQKVDTLEDEAFAMPMVETTRDIYRQKAALDIHLAVLHLQHTMISALCLRQVGEKIFWPKNAALLFGDLQDNLGEKLIEFERMRKQCDDIQNLIFNTISIEESRAAVDQGRSVGRLTWLTFIFLPLSFGASILGMNVFQLDSPGLWLYFALTVPLFIIITGCIVLLKANVLYSQSGHKDIGFIRWLLSGRPIRSQLDRADLERGSLTSKLKDRLRGPDWHQGGAHSDLKQQKEAKIPSKKED